MPPPSALVRTPLHRPIPPAAAFAALLLALPGRRAAAQEATVHVEGYAQADARFYPSSGSDAPPSTYLIRRARVVVQGTVARYFGFLVVPDISRGTASLAEATLGARVSEQLELRAGLTKPRIGLEPTLKSADLHLIERGLPAYLLPARDLGIDLGGELFGRALTYDLGVFNGVPDYGTSHEDTGNAKDVAGRLFLTPFRDRGDGAAVDLGVGLGVSAGHEAGTPESPLVSTLRSPGQADIFAYRGVEGIDPVIADGRRWRFDPQAYLYHGPVGVMAEYVESHHQLRRGRSRATFRHRAWQVAGSLFLTGERAGFGTILPRHPFEPERGAWGALELAARVEGADADPAAFPLFADATRSAREARGVGIGVNWYFARRTKLMIEYERTTFRGGAPGGDRAPESFLAARFQVSR